MREEALARRQAEIRERRKRGAGRPKKVQVPKEYDENGNERGDTGFFDPADDSWDESDSELLHNDDYSEPSDDDAEWWRSLRVT